MHVLEYFSLPLSLEWLPEHPEFSHQLRSAQQLESAEALQAMLRLSQTRVDFVSANRLDKVVQKQFAAPGFAGSGTASTLPSIRVALVGSSTLSHLAPGIRLAGLRRGLRVELYTGPYGLYRQELLDPASDLHAFKPEVIVLALDADHLAARAGATAEAVIETLRPCWQAAKAMGAVVLQQTVMPRMPQVAGNNEDRFPHSPAAVIRRINGLLREQAVSEGFNLLALDDWICAHGGMGAWFDPALWHLSKHEVQHAAALFYGDQVGRMLAAIRGRSAKCLVLDLDNTLWGGVIGDDGLDGILLGQGNPVGEAHIAVQRYAAQLADRGILLAVCSKNDEENARAPFTSHPEMVLKNDHISCFVANWQDKASNLRYIAKTLNIGLDSLVFLDDNPAERALVRRELPMVAVPELPEEPSTYVSILESAGYFEALALTEEDKQRTELYRANASREAHRSAVTNMEDFLQSLQMKLSWSPFTGSSLARVVQLINKTNQFNLTTKRCTETEIQQVMREEDEGNLMTLQLRLEDIYGENGIIALIIGRKSAPDQITIDTWLMSCRVLGREVERATLNLIVERALEMNCTTLRGIYKPTDKNSMVKDLYGRLGFTQIEIAEDESTLWTLSLSDFQPYPVHMTVNGASACPTNAYTSNSQRSSAMSSMTIPSN